VSASHFVIDAARLAGQFEREPFAVRHRLTDHALLQLPRLIELATVLPESSVEYNQADLPIEQEYLATPRNGLTIDQTMRQIEDCKSWMVLKNVERDPQYKALLDECLEEIAPHVRTMSPQLEHREAFVFVSSPQAVTPYHCDPEHNFLLQIRGNKVMTIFDRGDPRAISERHMEAMASARTGICRIRKTWRPSAGRSRWRRAMGCTCPCIVPTGYASARRSPSH
jgi:hypothetical protein